MDGESWTTKAHVEKKKNEKKPEEAPSAPAKASRPTTGPRRLVGARRPNRPNQPGRRDAPKDNKETHKDQPKPVVGGVVKQFVDVKPAVPAATAQRSWAEAARKAVVAAPVAPVHVQPTPQAPPAVEPPVARSAPVPEPEKEVEQAPNTWGAATEDWGADAAKEEVAAEDEAQETVEDEPEPEPVAVVAPTPVEVAEPAAAIPPPVAPAVQPRSAPSAYRPHLSQKAPARTEAQSEAQPGKKALKGLWSNASPVQLPSGIDEYVDTSYSFGGGADEEEPAQPAPVHIVEAATETPNWETPAALLTSAAPQPAPAVQAPAPAATYTPPQPAPVPAQQPLRHTQPSPSHTQSAPAAPAPAPQPAAEEPPFYPYDEPLHAQAEQANFNFIAEATPPPQYPPYQRKPVGHHHHHHHAHQHTPHVHHHLHQGQAGVPGQAPQGSAGSGDLGKGGNNPPGRHTFPGGKGQHAQQQFNQQFPGYYGGPPMYPYYYMGMGAEFPYDGYENKQAFAQPRGGYGYGYYPQTYMAPMSPPWNYQQQFNPNHQQFQQRRGQQFDRQSGGAAGGSYQGNYFPQGGYYSNYQHQHGPQQPGPN